jgi:hypothetical protein
MYRGFDMPFGLPFDELRAKLNHRSHTKEPGQAPIKIIGTRSALTISKRSR